MTVTSGGTSTLTVTASNATQVVISDNLDSTTYTLAPTGGTQVVTPDCDDDLYGDCHWRWRHGDSPSRLLRSANWVRRI